MQQVLNTLLEFLKQGIAAVFRFFQLIFNWAFDQFLRLTQLHFDTLPVWKKVGLATTVVIVIGLLIRAGKELWEAGERILNAFVTLLSALVRVLPWVLIAGVVAFLGMIIIHNVNF